MTNIQPIILAVDDDPNDLLFLHEAFKFVGRQTSIQSVIGGEEAIAYLAAEGIYADRVVYPYPNYVLTDLKMPGVDGFSVLEFLKKTPECAYIRAVVLSGSQHEEDVKKAYRLGASGYLVKPSSPLDLRKIVKALHDFWLFCERPEGSGMAGACPSGDHDKSSGDFSSETFKPGPGREP